MTATTLADLLSVNARLFANVTTDVADEEAARRIDGTNSFQYIAGHYVEIVCNLALITGQAEANPYTERFGFGTRFDPTGEGYPALSALLADHAAIAPKVEAAVRAMSDEQLAAASPFPLPFAQQTVQGLLAFQQHHLGYTIGQLGLYRRFLGHEAMGYA